MGKMSAYETDVNLPFYVRGPGVPKGIQLPHLVGGSQLPHLVGRSDVLWGSCRPGRLQGLPAGQQRVVVLLGGGPAGRAAASGCPACSRQGRYPAVADRQRGSRTHLAGARK